MLAVRARIAAVQRSSYVCTSCRFRSGHGVSRSYTTAEVPPKTGDNFNTASAMSPHSQVTAASKRAAKTETKGLKQSEQAPAEMKDKKNGQSDGASDRKKAPRKSSGVQKVPPEVKIMRKRRQHVALERAVQQAKMIAVKEGLARQGKGVSKGKNVQSGKGSKSRNLQEKNEMRSVEGKFDREQGEAAGNLEIGSIAAKPSEVSAAIMSRAKAAPGKQKRQLEGGKQGKFPELMKVLKKNWNETKKLVAIKQLDPSKLQLEPIIKEQPPVPRLSFGLDRVLFNPGVYQLQDSRSRVYNFDPYLSSIMPTSEFDFNALKRFVSSSQDEALHAIAVKQQKKYSGSTSSMSSMMSHFHYLLSNFRDINPNMLSRSFKPEGRGFTQIQRIPCACFLHWKNGTYAIDADKEFDGANVLSMMGKSMEKLLTLSKDDFEKYRKSNSDQLTEEERNSPESYHYTQMGDMLMRSQLDAYDPRLPGTGMFDLKTRAVVSVRMDTIDYEEGTGYEIWSRRGHFESYEREYYDMIRSAFLKYSMQVRMGRMDGIFVAYHNVKRIFGFQYISLAEMDLAIHGTEDPRLGDQEFKASLSLVNEVLDRATARFPRQSLRIHIETRNTNPAFMTVFAIPVTDEQIERIQSKKRAAIEEYEMRMMGLEPERRGSDANREAKEEVEDAKLAKKSNGSELEARRDADPETSLDVWEDMMERVEDALKDEEQGIGAIREAIENALEQSCLLQSSSPELSDQYLDALVEAVTSAVKLNQESTKMMTVDEEANADLDGTAEDAEPAAAEATESEAESAGGLKESEPTKIPEEDETGEAVEKTFDGPRIAQEEPSLTELIVQLTSRIHEPEAVEEDDSPDADKLEKFKQILSELTSKSQTPETSSETTTEAETAKEEMSACFSRVDIPTFKAEALPEQLDPSKNKMPLMGMVVTVRSRINGKYINRPDNPALRSEWKWDIEYSIEELGEDRVHTLYQHTVDRRRKAFESIEDHEKRFQTVYGGVMPGLSEKGRKMRAQEDEYCKNKPVYVYGREEPLEWKEVFGASGCGKETEEAQGKFTSAE